MMLLLACFSVCEGLGFICLFVFCLTIIACFCFRVMGCVLRRRNGTNEYRSSSGGGGGGGGSSSSTSSSLRPNSSFYWIQSYVCCGQTTVNRLEVSLLV